MILVSNLCNNEYFIKENINMKNTMNVLNEIMGQIKLSEYQKKFNSPLVNSFLDLYKKDNNSISDKNDQIEKQQKGICDPYYGIVQNNDKGLLFLLQSFDSEDIYYYSIDDIITFFDQYEEYPLIKKFCNMYQERQAIPKRKKREFKYLRNRKDLKLKYLRKFVNILKKPDPEFEPISELPNDICINIFKACKKGHLNVVQYLFENGIVDNNVKCYIDYDCDYGCIVYDDTPFHIAALYGHLNIVQYFVIKKYVDIDVKGLYERTPLHCACENGYLSIVIFLVSHGANI